MPGVQIQRAPEINAKPIAKHKIEDNKFTKKSEGGYGEELAPLGSGLGVNDG